MPLTILGIRHHGVGSTQNVIEMLEQIQPDMVLVEGAPELDSIISWIGNEQLCPPVAVLGYNVDDPNRRHSTLLRSFRLNGKPFFMPTNAKFQ
jgi:hypothetical protein